MEKQSNCGRPAGRKKTSKIEVSIEPEVKEVFMQLLHQDGKTASVEIGRSTGNNFMEPHHLIPISCQDNYSVTIDITSNLICLCPNCHSKIHYGQKTDIEAMLKKFLSLRKTDLKNYGGIDIDEATLLAYYNI